MCLQPMSLTTPKGQFSVGCNKCYKCKRKRKMDWQFRMQIEAENSETADFITLTYNEHSVPNTKGVKHLYKPDLQLFIKRLRHQALKFHREENNYTSWKQTQKNSPQLRYFACGEYGSQTQRPHYHMILFNYPRQIKEQILDVWDLGQVQIGTVTGASINYTSKYMMKPYDEVTSNYPMFNTMSRRPAIGHQYFGMKQWHYDNQTLIVKDRQGNMMLLPRYYRKKMFSQHWVKKTLEKHIKEFHIALRKEEERLTQLGEDIKKVELDSIRDNLRRLQQAKLLETL